MEGGGEGLSRWQNNEQWALRVRVSAGERRGGGGQPGEGWGGRRAGGPGPPSPCRSRPSSVDGGEGGAGLAQRAQRTLVHITPIAQVQPLQLGASTAKGGWVGVEGAGARRQVSKCGAPPPPPAAPPSPPPPHTNSRSAPQRRGEHWQRQRARALQRQPPQRRAGQRQAPQLAAAVELQHPQLRQPHSNAARAWGRVGRGKEGGDEVSACATWAAGWQRARAPYLPPPPHTHTRPAPLPPHTLALPPSPPTHTRPAPLPPPTHTGAHLTG